MHRSCRSSPWPAERSERPEIPMLWSKNLDNGGAGGFGHKRRRSSGPFCAPNAPSPSEAPGRLTAPSFRLAPCLNDSPLPTGRNGGAGGIRTLDTALQPYNGLANRRLQPLGHSSIPILQPATAEGIICPLRGRGSSLCSIARYAGGAATAPFQYFSPLRLKASSGCPLRGQSKAGLLSLFRFGLQVLSFAGQPISRHLITI